MSYQIIGKLSEVHDTVNRTETFSVREFVLEVTSPTSQYADYVLFQLTNTRTGLIDMFTVGQEVVVDFDIQGRKWTNPEGRIVFFNRLNAWRISAYNAQAMMGGQAGYQQPMGQGFQPQGQGFQPQQPMGGQAGFQPMGGQPMQGGFQQPPMPPQQTPTTGDNADDLPF